MKKVGIVSLYVGQNFGNKLQNYATEQICLEYGFQPYTFKINDDRIIKVPILLASFARNILVVF